MVAQKIGKTGIRSVAIDTEQGFLTFGLVKSICQEMKGQYLRLNELSAAPIASAVRDNLFHDPGITTTSNFHYFGGEKP
jgi:Mg-chelatase subunit ChlD